MGGVISHLSSGGTDSEESGTEESDSAGEGQESDSTGQGEGEGEGQGEGDGDGSGASRDGSGGDLEEVSMETDMPAAGGGLEQASRVPSVFVQLRRPAEVQVSVCVESGATHLEHISLHYSRRSITGDGADNSLQHSLPLWPLSCPVLLTTAHYTLLTFLAFLNAYWRLAST